MINVGFDIAIFDCVVVFLVGGREEVAVVICDRCLAAFAGGAKHDYT